MNENYEARWNRRSQRVTVAGSCVVGACLFLSLWHAVIVLTIFFSFSGGLFWGSS